MADLGPDAPKGETRDIAASAAGFGSGKTLDRAKIVVEHGTPELIEAMDKGEIKIRPASEIARLPKEEQQKVTSAA